MMYRALILILLFFPVLNLQGQNTTPEVLRFEDFLEQVMVNHPLAQRSDLQRESGVAGLRAARGAFDPNLRGDADAKSFDGKNYFRRADAGIDLPTRLGITLTGGYSFADGQYLNPEWNLPAVGLYNAGVEVNLGKGLLIDRARASLRQAKVYVQRTEAERLQMRNDLAVVAAAAYWDWVQAWHEREIYRQALVLAQDRFEGVKSGFQLGDRPAIDTVEARIQVQNRRYNLNKAEMKLAEMQGRLSSMLWDTEGRPLELRSTISAPVVARPNTTVERSLISEWVEAHPLLQFYALKARELEVDRRYKAEQLRPKIALKYNFLTAPPEAQSAQGLQNYKVGMVFRFPLLLRQARGELELARIKIKQNQWTYEEKRWELQTKVKALERKID
ncbi:MAG: TolC family protein, partial [Bacteroidota bacterium]